MADVRICEASAILVLFLYPELMYGKNLQKCATLIGEYFCRMQNNKVADARELFGACGSWRLLMKSFICLCEIWREIYRKLIYILCIKSFSSEGNYKLIDGAVFDVMSDKLQSQ